MKFIPARLKQLIPEGKAKVIAEAADVSAGGLSQWASGARSPGAEELARVAGALGVSMDYFFEGRSEAVTTEALRESPAEYLIDEVIAEAQEIRERAARLEMKAQKLKPTKQPSKPPRLPLTPENLAKVKSEIENDQKDIQEGIAKLTRRVIADVDNPVVKPEGKKK